MKFGTVILWNVAKKIAGKYFQNCSYKDDDVTSYVNFFGKIIEKMAKMCFFF